MRLLIEVFFGENDKKEREAFLATHVIEPEVETSNLRELTRYGFLMVQDNNLFERRWMAVSNGFLYIYKDWKVCVLPFDKLAFIDN